MEPWIEPDGGEALTYAHPTRPLGEVLRRRVEPLMGEFGDAQPITVHLDGRVSVRDRQAAYKSAMFLAHAGDLVFSKIDARNGAIGLVPDAISRAVVTPEFPIFAPDPEALDARFVPLMLSTGLFGAAIRAKATGTTGRKRITAQDFESLRVPLPPLPEQRAMVAAFEAGVAEADALARRAAEVRRRRGRSSRRRWAWPPPRPCPSGPSSSPASPTWTAGATTPSSAAPRALTQPPPPTRSSTSATSSPTWRTAGARNATPAPPKPTSGAC